MLCFALLLLCFFAAAATATDGNICCPTFSRDSFFSGMTRPQNHAQPALREKTKRLTKLAMATVMGNTLGLPPETCGYCYFGVARKTRVYASPPLPSPPTYKL